MARIRLCSYINGVSGRMGDAIYYNRRGTACMRKISAVNNPDTLLQRHNRTCFRDAVHAWQILPETERFKWNKRAYNKRASGYNLFISDFMKRNGTAGSTVRDTLMQRRVSAYNPFILRLSSVCTPNHYPYSFNAPPGLQEMPGKG